MSVLAHNCGDSKLSCTDCGAQICPKCFVQCAVGFRCKKCSGKLVSHVEKITPAIFIRTAVAAGAIGMLYGQLRMGFGFSLMIIVTLVGGLLVGKVLHRIAAYKLGTQILTTVILAYTIGAFFSPIGDTLRYLVTIAPEVHDGGTKYVTEMATQYWMSAMLFLAGILLPFLRRG